MRGRRILAVGTMFVIGAGAADAWEPLNRLKLEEASSLADNANPAVRAEQFEVQAVGANEMTAAPRPNPSATFLAEQFGGGSAAHEV